SSDEAGPSASPAGLRILPSPTTKPGSRISRRSHPAALFAGPTSAENLALACVTCSLKKAARTHGRDPVSKELVPLFHPRQDRWSDHFGWSRGCRLIGRTSTGRATILALGMNRPAVIAIRKALVKLGWLPLGARVK